MAEPSPPAPPANQKNSGAATKITDLDEDTLAKCAALLSIEDISNMAMTCKTLKQGAYSDSLWGHLFWEHWGVRPPYSSLHGQGVRGAYVAKHTAVHAFKFDDPLTIDVNSSVRPFDHILFDRNDMMLAQGSLVRMLNIDGLVNANASLVTLNGHKGKITCMRTFPLSETSLHQTALQRNENVLITSSCDRSIRIWWKGTCQRCFRGHNGPVSILSDKLLGDGSSKFLASGGEDGTVRVWSLCSSGKRGRHALKTTFYGHEKPVKLISVAGHKSSLLVSISNDSKVRVCDANSLSASRTASCVGMTSVHGAPVSMKCHESMLYVAAGFSVVAVDLRTMQKVFTGAIHEPYICSFEILPSKSLICTGGNDRAMLWDIRRNQERMEPKPVVDLDGNSGCVAHLHMDPYKIVTGSRSDPYVKVWDVDTGKEVNSLACFNETETPGLGCSAMAVSGSRIVTSYCGRERGCVRFRDFTPSTIPIATHDDAGSKFWGRQSPQSDSDTDSETFSKRYGSVRPHLIDFSFVM